MNWLKRNRLCIPISLAIGLVAACIFAWDPFFCGIAFVIAVLISIVWICPKIRMRDDAEPPEDTA